MLRRTSITAFLALLAMGACAPGDVPSTAKATAPAPAALSTVESLERGAITYHAGRSGAHYHHSDMAVADSKGLVHFVYSRQSGDRYRVYYQQRPIVDYDLHPTPELLIADEPVADLTAYQYPRIATDAQGGVHIIWVAGDRLSYVFCSSGDSNCTQQDGWEAAVTTSSPTAGCPIQHPSVAIWEEPELTRWSVVMSAYLGGATNQIALTKVYPGDRFSPWTVVTPRQATPRVQTPSIAIAPHGDRVHVVWYQEGAGLMYAAVYSEGNVSQPTLLAAAGNAAIAPAQLAWTDDYLGNHVSNHGFAATDTGTYVAWPNTSGRIVFLSCGRGCDTGAPIDISGIVGSTAAHDVRLSTTPDGEPVLAWKTPSNQVMVSRAFKGTWGKAETLPTFAHSFLANLAFRVDPVGSLHVGWTDMTSGATPTSDDDYLQLAAEPLIFIPGTLGSTLFDGDNDWGLWPLPYDDYGSYAGLTLDPHDSSWHSNVVAGHVQAALYADGLLDRLHHNIYREYEVGDLDARRTTAGCDVAAQRANRPTFFPFAYDWRQSTGFAVLKLEDYIGCIRQFYPTRKINLVAHSLGNLVAKRYLLTHGTSEVRSFTAIGAPWWGVPSSLAAYEGQYMPQIPQATEARVNRTLPVIAEESAGAASFAEGGMPPIHVDGVNFAGDGTFHGPLSYPQYVAAMRLHYTPMFAAWNESLHTASQDHTTPLLDGVEVHTIATNNVDPHSPTTVSNVVQPSSYCFIGVLGEATCYPFPVPIPPTVVPIKAVGGGDSTIPRSVLEGDGNQQGPNAELVQFTTSEYQHSEQLSMPEIQDCLLTVLAGGWCRHPLDKNLPPPVPEARFVTLVGFNRVMVTDAGGRTKTIDVAANSIQGDSPIGAQLVGSERVLLMLSTQDAVTVDLRQAQPYAWVEVLKGPSTVSVNEMTRFSELGLEPQSVAILSIGPAGPGQFVAAQTGDGTKRLITPSAKGTGPGLDIEGPTVTFSRTVLDPHTVRVAVAADDPSGVDQVWASVDGVHFTPYAGPMTVDTLVAPAVHAFAVDKENNRSVVYSFDTTNLGFSGPATASESAGTLAIPVTLDADHAHEVRVGYRVEGRSATAGSDFTAIEGTLVFASRQTSQVISVPIINDALDEDDEDLVVTLELPRGAGFNTRQRTAVIVDDDSAPTVGFQASAFTGDERNGTIAATVALSAPSDHDVVVQYATSDGSAVAPGDYPATVASITIPRGSTSGTIAIPLVANTAWEPTEWFGLTLTGATNATLGAQRTATMNVTNDKLEVRPDSSYVNENAGTLTIPVYLSSPREEEVTVEYAAVPIEATPGQDYEPATGLLRFPPGTTRQTFSLRILEDTQGEPAERISFTLSNPTNARVAYGYWFVQIQPNDHLSFASSGTTIEESNSAGGNVQISVLVSLDAASALPVSVDYATVNGTAQAGSDYVAVQGTLTFAPGQGTLPIPVTIINDTLPEGDETFTVRLSNPVNAALGARTTHTVTIRANDSGAKP